MAVCWVKRCEHLKAWRDFSADEQHRYKPESKLWHADHCSPVISRPSWALFDEPLTSNFPQFQLSSKTLGTPVRLPRMVLAGESLDITVIAQRSYGNLIFSPDCIDAFVQASRQCTLAYSEIRVRLASKTKTKFEDVKAFLHCILTSSYEIIKCS